MTPHTTSRISIAPGLIIDTVPLSDLNGLTSADTGPRLVSGSFVHMYEFPDAEHKHYCFAGRADVPYPQNINQDTSYLLRREIAEQLRQSIGNPSLKIAPDDLASVQMGIWRQAYPVAEDDILGLCASNTQDLLNKIMDELGLQPIERLADTAVADPTQERYRHTSLFARLYLHSARGIASVLESCPAHQRIVVIDIGCGRGNGMFSCARELAKKKLLERVHFVGCDISKRDLRIARAAAKRMPGLDVEFIETDLLDGHLGDFLRALKPAFVMCHHVIEHLQGPLENRVLQDMLHAAGARVCVSVPLDDPLATSISSHVHEFSAEAVRALGRAMVIRCAGAVKCFDPEPTSRIGLIDWVREPKEAFGREHLIISPRSRTISWSKRFEAFGKPFDPRLMNLAHRALKVGSVPNPALFEQEGKWPSQVRQMVIKTKGKKIFLPAEFAQCADAIRLMAEHNMAINPCYEEYYAYLNVFRGPMSFDAYRGLSLNLHGDQLQNLRGENAYPSDYSYICSNTLPTVFFDQAFDISEAIEASRNRSQPVNLYDWLNRQARDDARYYSDNFGIYLLSPYVVHAAQAAVDRNGEFRIFLKVAFSQKRFFDNRELRVNHAIDCSDWQAAWTVGYSDGWLNHAHWNERFLWEDLVSGGGK